MVEMEDDAEARQKNPFETVDCEAYGEFLDYQYLLKSLYLKF